MSQEERFKSGNYPSNLWKHQKEALEFLIEHLNAKPQKGPCIVRMPTGTGKTGVIAWLSMISAKGRTLVLTPWTNLRDQMVEALKVGFWKSSEMSAPQLSVHSLLPSSAQNILADPNVKVIVSSLAALTDLRREDEKSYKALKEMIDLVIVDEGHYEPAVEWGKSVKGLSKPTVLMTATPYRNDLKLFHISDPKQSVWQFRHYEAESDEIIRSLEFQSLGSSADLDSLVKAFAAFWKKTTQSKGLVSGTPRAIICCADSLKIEFVVTKLRSEGISTLGVHDRFRNTPSKGFYRDVPSVGTDAEVWVHQYKLVEGLDDHRFCCVALFCPIQNDRKLVQQIGRALRKHESDRAGKKAILLAPDEFDAKNSWQAYLEFEKHAQLVTIGHYRAVVEQLLSLQPEAEYFDGHFRKRFDTSNLGQDPKITISPSVLIRKVNSNFSLNDYIVDCTDTLLMNDAIILGKDDFGPCVRATDHALWVYASVRNSRLLERDALYEIRLEAHCAVVSDGYLLISDTAGSYPIEYLEDQTTGIDPGELSSLLDNTFKLTNLSVSSAIPFDNVVRAAEIRGSDIAKIPASLTDRVQICRSARGASTAHGRRYVGIKRGRVRQELSANQLRSHSLSVFIAWCHSVTRVLGAGSISNGVFGRYMQTCSPPPNLVAKNICVDLVRMGAGLFNRKGEPVRTKKSASSMELIGGSSSIYQFILEFEVLAHPYATILEKLTVEYQPHKKRFWFKTGGEEQIRVAVSDPRFPNGRSLHDYLNLNQDLVLIGLAKGEVVYQGRDFYAIDYLNAEKSLLDRIVTLSGAAKCATEKGTKEELEAAKGLNGHTKQDAFAKGSLFKAIVSEQDVIPFKADLLVCDDLNSECADFIAADTANQKLALLHAKIGDGAKISASSFHEVVAQAIKNLAYLSPNAETPEGASSWKIGSFWNQTAVERIVKVPPNSTKFGIDLWTSLKTDIIQSADGELHVVLVTAGCCDRQRLQDAIDNRSKRTPETAQLFHLLEGLNGYARQLGVRLTVIDIPFDERLVIAAKQRSAAKKAASNSPASKSAPAAKSALGKGKSKSKGP
ncbi:MAG: DEAD/DEAH box helicase [Betaproteobacteria bacterium]|nr:MAG: DEAD/DEAH box helicase [Betaproteobacteria bacterium]